MLVKDWHWRSHLGIGPAYKLISPASAPKYPCTLFIRKNESLCELGHRRFLGRLSLEKIMCLNFAGEHTQKCDREKRERLWHQVKSIYRLYLDLVVKQFHYINSLNTWATNFATFRNQKLYWGTVFL